MSYTINGIEKLVDRSAHHPVVLIAVDAAHKERKPLIIPGVTMDGTNTVRRASRKLATMAKKRNSNIVVEIVTT